MTKRMLMSLCALLALGVAQARGPQNHGDEVLEWNRIAFDLVLNQQHPPEQMRFGAILHLAIFEGVNAVSGDHQSTLDTLSPSRGASASAAAVGAAHRVLRTYFPDHAAAFDAARERSLARIPNGPARRAGLEAGEAAAIAVMASRENDGSESPEFYVPGSNDPGEWQPTPSCPPMGGPYLHWGKVKTFVIRNGEQFRLPPPPALNSDRYAEAYQEVLENGARDSKKRPPDRTQVAHFYDTFGDAALWNPIARQLARAKGQSLTENARTFALLNLGLHDLTVALVDTKYHYHFWRPETAIPAAGSDGNDRTMPDASFVPLVTTPCHPSYDSGHAATSAVSREILERAFGGSGHKIVVVNPAMPGIVLRYSELEQITKDIDDARVYGGIHFRFDQTGGGEQGRQVGAYVWQHALKPKCRPEKDKS